MGNKASQSVLPGAVGGGGDGGVACVGGRGEQRRRCGNVVRPEHFTLSRYPLSDKGGVCGSLTEKGGIYWTEI